MLLTPFCNTQTKPKLMNTPYSFQTPVGKVRVLDDDIVHVHLSPSKFTVGGFESHYRLLHDYIGDNKHAYLYSFENCFLKNMDAEERHLLLQKINEDASILATVVTNPMCRVVLKILMKLGHFKVETGMFRNEKQATRFLKDVIREKQLQKVSKLMV